MTPEQWEQAWTPINEGLIRRAAFGAWTIEQCSELTEDGATLKPVFFAPDEDLGEFTDVSAARAYAEDLLRACEFVESVTPA